MTSNQTNDNLQRCLYSIGLERRVAQGEHPDKLFSEIFSQYKNQGLKRSDDQVAKLKQCPLPCKNHISLKRQVEVKVFFFFYREPLKTYGFKIFFIIS